MSLRITREYCSLARGWSPMVMQVRPFSCSSSPGLQFPKEGKGLFLVR